MKLLHLLMFGLMLMNAPHISAQPETVPYQKLKLDDAVTKLGDHLKTMDDLGRSDFSIVFDTKGHTYVLLKKSNNTWDKYTLPIDAVKSDVVYVSMPSANVVAVRTALKHIAGQEGEMQTTYFIDIRSLQYFSFVNYYTEMHVDLGTDEMKILLECSATFSIVGDTFRLSAMDADRPDREQCLTSADYRMEQSGLVRLK